MRNGRRSLPLIPLMSAYVRVSVSNGTRQCNFSGQRNRSSFIDNGTGSKSCQGPGRAGTVCHNLGRDEGRDNHQFSVKIFCFRTSFSCLRTSFSCFFVSLGRWFCPGTFRDRGFCPGTFAPALARDKGKWDVPSLFVPGLPTGRTVPWKH